MAHLLDEAIQSCADQDYDNIELIILDDASTDNPEYYEKLKRQFVWMKYFRSDEPSGTGGAFNKAIAKSTGEYIVLLCADDVFTHKQVISDIAEVFDKSPQVGHVTRYYHQFIDGDRRPVRAWRCNDVFELGNNPSGLAFRREALKDGRTGQFYELSNKMFVEAVTLVHSVVQRSRWGCCIIAWDTVAVRIHQSISRNKAYYRKRWTSSPVEEWTKAGGTALQHDFTSLVQIKNYFTTSAVIKECFNFLKLRPINIIEPGFWFFGVVSILTPRFVLMRLPHWYRVTFGRWTTKELKRP